MELRGLKGDTGDGVKAKGWAREKRRSILLNSDTFNTASGQCFRISCSMIDLNTIIQFMSSVLLY